MRMGVMVSGYRKPYSRRMFLVLMLSIVFTLLLSSSVFAENSYSKEKPFGVGIIVGSPTGISFRYVLNETNGIDVGLAWSVRKNEYLQINGSYIWSNNAYLQKNYDLPIGFHYGAGAKMVLGDITQLGIRGIIGVFHVFSRPLVDLLFELEPGITLIPATSFDIDAILGARIFFSI